MKDSSPYWPTRRESRLRFRQLVDGCRSIRVRGEDAMSDETIIEETKRFLIEQKVSFVNSAVSAGMLWWVSSILFCGSALAGVWSAQEDLKKSQGILVGLGIILFVFLGAIAIFGFIGAYRLCIVQSEIADLAKKLKFLESGGKGFFYEEIQIYRIAMTIGGGSFALIHVGWFVFWLRLLGWAGYSYGVICIVVWILLGLIYWWKASARYEQVLQH